MTSHQSEIVRDLIDLFYFCNFELTCCKGLDYWLLWKWLNNWNEIQCVCPKTLLTFRIYKDLFHTQVIDTMKPLTQKSTLLINTVKSLKQTLSNTKGDMSTC